jgi:hypothetical protein
MRGLSFAGWIVVGALLALTVIGALSIGVFVLPLFGLAFAYVSRHTRYPLDALGGLVGIGAVLLAVAYVNRDSRPCAAGYAFSCGGFDPHPWLFTGLVFAGVGLIGYATLRTLSRRYPCRRPAK